MNENNYETLASEFVNAIKELAEKPDNLANMESYLSRHFPKWMKWANTPEAITDEFKSFAAMDCR